MAKDGIVHATGCGISIADPRKLFPPPSGEITRMLSDGVGGGMSWPAIPRARMLQPRSPVPSDTA
eukprot:8756902-Lingulodinium_polyedra.AAC.1